MGFQRNKTLRFGILGCGVIAGVHAEAIGSLDEAELAGASDFNAQFGRQFCEKRGVRFYDSYDEMLADESIDVISVCTPSHCHADNAIRALRAGKHVVLEKPMALTMEEAERVASVCEETGLKLTVVSQLRFSPDIQKVKRLVEEGAFGRLVFCNLSMRYWRSEEYFSASSWRGRREFEGGGALMNQGIHGIDLMQYILGVPRVIKGVSRTLHHDIDVEDCAAALIEFEGGTMGMIQGSTCTWPGFERRLEIHGDKGFAVLRENVIERMETPQEKLDRRAEMDNQAETSANRADAIDSSMHAMQIQNLIDAIHGRAELLMDAREGCKAIGIIEAIYHS